MSVEISSRRREPLSRTGVELSLVRMRGSLENLEAWVGDAEPAIGVFRLRELVAELAGWAVPSSQAGEVLALGAALRTLCQTWPAAPELRLSALLAARDLVVRWLAVLEAESG